MSEIFAVEEDPGFWDNMGQGDGTESAETPAQDEVTEETEETVEPVEPQEPVEEEPEEELAPAANAEIVAQLANLEKRLNDKDDFIGRQGNELAELRAMRERMEANMNRPSLDNWDEMVDENPAQAAKQALEAGDNRRYQEAKAAWEDVSPGAPENFEKNLMLTREIAQMKEQLHSKTAPIEERAVVEQMARAYSTVQDKYPDFTKFEDAMAATLEARPLIRESLQKVLQSGDLNAQIAAVEDLYLLTAGRTTDTLREATEVARDKTAAKTKELLADAQVASGSAATDAPKATAADVIANEWDELETARASGWNIQ